jgi:precorrin-2 dehydrogenase
LTFVSPCYKILLVKTYTICLVGLHTQQAIVVGGGGVAGRKVEGFLAADFQVKVISPKLTAELQSLVSSGTLTYVKRPYLEGDLKGAFLVIAATSDPVVNQAVWAEAIQRGCLINVVDDPQHSNFILPAVLQRGEMSIAISTGGASPALARRLRERLEGLIGPDYETLTALLAELRPELIASFPAGKARLQAALRVVDSNILHIIKSQGRDAALNYARQQLHQQL